MRGDMARFTTDILAKLAIVMAFFVVVAIAPSCAMPECLGLVTDMDMECADYMMVEDSPDGVVSADAPTPVVVAVAALASPEPPVVEQPIVTELVDTGPSPPLSPLGERLSV